MNESWQATRVIVTGGAGFLGGFVVERLRAAGALVSIPRSSEIDLCDWETCVRYFRDERPEIVIHAAVDGGGIGYMRENPASIGLNNLLMALNVLRASQELKVRRFVGVSSICAYPRDTPVPMREQDIWAGYPEPSNGSYGVSKRVMMDLGASFRAQYGLNTVFPMPVNLYGPRDDFDPRSSHVVPALIRRFLAAKRQGAPEVVAWGTGRATRELLYVEDCAEAIVLAAERLDTSEPFNLGTGLELTVASIAHAVARAVGFEGRIRWDASFPDGQPRKFLDTSRAREWLGWQATTSLEQGLSKSVSWYLSHEGPQT